MKAGRVFPPIIVARHNKQNIVVDGWHRIEATKRRGEEHIQAEILYGLTKKQIFIEAVKRNIEHGQQLSASEVAGIIVKLEDMKLDIGKISKIVGITVDKMQSFVADRMVNSITGEPIILKSPLKHLHGGQPISVDITEIQDKFGGVNQIALLDELILLLEEGLIDLSNGRIKERLDKVNELLDKLMIKA